MKGALIGFGTIANGHLSAYQQIPEVSIVAIVDPIPKRLKLARKIDKNLRVYKTIEELLSKEELDFIDICSPPNTHLEYIKKGVGCGCHVLCEKPFLCSTEDYKGLLSFVNQNEVTLYPCHNYKFAPILKQIYKHVRSKEFGQIVSGHFRTLRSGHAVGVPEWNPHWRREQKISRGGILRDHGTHSVYMATYLTGELPSAVSCLIGNLRNDPYTENEDTALLTLYFSKNKYFLIDLSWAASFRNSYYSIVGVNGVITVENDQILYSQKGRLAKKIITSEFNDPTHKAWFVDVIYDFLNAVKSPARQEFLLNETLITSLVIDKAYESAKLGGIKLNLPRLSKNML